MAKLNKSQRAHVIAVALFLLPLVLVWLTLSSVIRIGGPNPGTEAAFIYLILWPLQIPLVVMIYYDISQWWKRRKPHN